MKHNYNLEKPNTVKWIWSTHAIKKQLNKGSPFICALLSPCITTSKTTNYNFKYHIGAEFLALVNCKALNIYKKLVVACFQKINLLNIFCQKIVNKSLSTKKFQQKFFNKNWSRAHIIRNHKSISGWPTFSSCRGFPITESFTIKISP